MEIGEVLESVGSWIVDSKNGCCLPQKKKSLRSIQLEEWMILLLKRKGKNQDDEAMIFYDF